MPVAAARMLRLPAWARYGIAVAAVAAATALRLALEPLWEDKLPLILFYPAIMVASWSGGFWPGTLTTLLSALAAEYLWMEPKLSLAVRDPAGVVGLLVFTSIGVMMSGLNEAWRRSAAAIARSEERSAAALAAAQAAEERLQVALEAGRLGTWDWTIPTGEVRWSPALEAIHGYAPGTFPRTFEAVAKEIHPEDRDRVLAAIREVVESGQEYRVDYRIVRTDGAVRWVEGRGRVLRDGAGRPERMAGVCSDVTERKQVESQRALLLEREREAREAAESASRLKDHFLAVVSHELRTPLNAVVGWAYLLRSGGLPPEVARRALEAIEENARAEARLVDSLLDHTRIMAGKLELEREPMELGSVVQAAVDTQRPAAAAKGVSIEVDVPASPVVVGADGQRLQQVVWNLVSNAVKFTPRGGRVAVRLAHTASEARIQVSDDGEGMSPEFVPHAFERFTQADTAGKRLQPGLGLGLAIVREIVHAHGGTVTAESPGPGRGSSFSVTLPGPVVATAPIGPDRSSARSPDTVGVAPRIAGFRVLVVDDSADTRELLALTLESHGALVHTAASSKEALEFLARESSDVLIADIAMPEEDGYALIRKLRAREAERGARRLRAIAVTGFANETDREQALADGYDGHLSKPVEPAALAGALAKLAGTESPPIVPSHPRSSPLDS